jgi:5-formyltetrahydrofolate cyclo-ligase
MPTPRLREGFLLLDPKRIPRSLYERASTIRGAFEMGVKLRSLEDLVNTIKNIDFIVEGSVVVNRCGERLGKGEGYGELEHAVLLELNLVDPNVIIATTVHELQVVEERIPQDPYDVPVDVIVTPRRVVRVQRCRSRPPGVLWDLLDERKLKEMPILGELRSHVKR